MSRLDPNGVKPVAESTDVDLFLNEVEEEGRHVQSVATGTHTERETPGDGYGHLIEFLQRRRKKTSRTRETIALERYETQKLAHPTTSDLEVAELAKFDKKA